MHTPHSCDANSILAYFTIYQLGCFVLLQTVAIPQDHCFHLGEDTNLVSPSVQVLCFRIFLCNEAKTMRCDVSCLCPRNGGHGKPFSPGPRHQLFHLLVEVYWSDVANYDIYSCSGN